MMKLRFLHLILLVLLAGAGAYLYFHSGKSEVPVPQEATIADSVEAKAGSSALTSNDLYTLSPKERNGFLLWANNQKDYQSVISATNEGIEKHRELVWDDIDFWLHRGFALYGVGDCPEAGAAFYHVLMREPENEVASEAMADVVNNRCGEVRVQ